MHTLIHNFDGFDSDRLCFGKTETYVYAGQSTETIGEVPVGGIAILSSSRQILFKTQVGWENIKLGNISIDGNQITSVSGNITLTPYSGYVYIDKGAGPEEVVTTSMYNVENVSDIVGSLLTSGTRNGISVSYDDTLGKINFQTSNPIISFTGDVTGTNTITNLSDTTFSMTLANSGAIAGTYTKLTINSKGIVTGAGSLSASDIPNLSWSKITSDKPTTLSGYGITNAVSTSGGTINGELVVTRILENVVDLGSRSTATTIDTSLGTYFHLTAAGSITFTFSNPPTTGKIGGFTLEITNGGAYTLVWPSSVRWPQGQAPFLTSTGTDLISFITRDGGVSWRASLLEKDSRSVS